MKKAINCEGSEQLLSKITQQKFITLRHSLLPKRNTAGMSFLNNSHVTCF